MSVSRGQVIYTNESSGTGSISIGVQQAYIIRVIDGVEQKNIYLNLTDYPNPTSDNLWLRLDEYFYLT